MWRCSSDIAGRQKKNWREKRVLKYTDWEIGIYHPRRAAFEKVFLKTKKHFQVI
jgi:hypothetical protein